LVARSADIYRYVRLAVMFDEEDHLDDVVYTEWRWESGTILPYAREYEHSCRRGVTFSR